MSVSTRFKAASVHRLSNGNTASDTAACHLRIAACSRWMVVRLVKLLTNYSAPVLGPGVCQYQGALVELFAYDEWHASLSPSGV
jgi:hypothetical protein